MATLHTNHRKQQRRNKRQVAPIVFDPTAGISIEQAAETALATAKVKNRAVTFNFNGIAMVAPPSRKATAEKLTQSFMCQITKRAEAWRASSEGVAYAKKRAAEVAHRQQSVTNAIQLLRRIVSVQGEEYSKTRLDAVVGWLSSFVEDCNDSEIDWDKAAGVSSGGKEWVALLLISGGYRESEYVGLDQKMFTRERLGRWIVGQAINCLRRGLPPHPSLAQRFAQEYFALSW